MIHENVLQRTPEWEELRKGRITGSKLAGLITNRGTGRKIGFYTLIAERLGAVDDDDQSSSRERGSELEADGIAKFTEKTGKEVRQVGFITSDENPNMALSPDGVVYDKDTISEAVEIKCLSASKHVKAIIENDIPSEYEEQAIQYFVVIPTLKTLHVVLYDPRIVAKPLVTFEIHREDKESEISAMIELEKSILAEVDKYVEELSF